MNRKAVQGSYLVVRHLLFALALSGLLLACLTQPVTAQLGPFDRDSARAMLEAVKDDLRKNYYDPNLRGFDLEARFKAAEERIKQAQTRDQLIIPIAQFLLDLNDSHTFFLPPFRAARVRYGWQMRMVGNECLISEVNPKSDGAGKGLKVGDTVLAVDGHRPSRDTLWKLNYRYYSLIPARSIRLTVIGPGESQPREIEVLSRIEKTAEVAQYITNIWRYNSETRFQDDRFYEQNDVIIWRMPGFDISPERIDQLMEKVRQSKALILDLRGNPGGYQVTLERLTGFFFENDLKIADLKGRKEMKPMLAKTRGDKVFKGELIVLVDSESGSAAELFARTIQLEKRGKVLGDHTSGSVMISQSFDHKTGVGSTLYYGASITIADVIMSDRKSLEKTGVVPDEVILPTASDIATRRDPVLARAAALAGMELPAEKAGGLFPVEWMK